MPEPGRRGVHNFLGNLTLPTIFVNDMLQGEVSRAGKTSGGLVINTTVGLGGFLDPASKIGIPGHGEDFGQTLAVWGVGEGPYLVLPFLGPSNPRDATGLAIDVAMDPTNHIPFKQHIWWDGGRIISPCWICGARPIRRFRVSSAVPWIIIPPCAACTASCGPGKFATAVRPVKDLPDF